MKMLKRSYMTLLAAILSLVIAISGIGFLAVSSIAFAVESSEPSPHATTVTAEPIAQGVSIPSKAKYGSKIDVPAGATVTAPSGLPIMVTENKITLKEIGTYKITVTGSGHSYDFELYSYVEEECEIYVTDNGADIPTYFKLESGKSFKLPTAKLVTYDEDGKQHDVAGTVEVQVTEGTKVSNWASAATEGTYEPTSSGLLYVTYRAQLENGDKIYTKEFTVKVQNEVNDTVAPVINVVNMPREVSVNRKFTLPTATVTDNLDENVKVKIEVKLGDKKVKQVEVNADGYARPYTDAAYDGLLDAVFDNGKQMSFYPTKVGETYTITYQAFDDVNGENKPSALQTYTVTCVDKVAPVFKSIDDWQIPEKWGLTVKQAKSATDKTTQDVDTGITFPTPDVVDNAGKEGLKVSFRLSNSENKTVINFSNILDTSDNTPGKKFTIGENSNYKDGEKTELVWGAFAFDFENVQFETKTGTYTAEYRATDAKDNSVVKTYTIEVSTTYTDVDYPTTAEVETPEYIIVNGADTTFTVPTPTVADKDAATTRLKVEYKFKSNATETSGYVLEKALKGGEKAEIKNDDTKWYLEFADGDKLLLNSDITVSLSVTDSVEQTKKMTEKTVKVVGNSAAGSFGTVTTTDLKVTGELKTNQDIDIGKFTVAGANLFTGYEVFVEDKDHNIVNNVSLETFYSGSGDNWTLNVRNIKFKVSKAGDYKAYVRVFTLGGSSDVYVLPMTVTATGGGGGSTTAPSAAVIPSTGNANVSYKFRNTSFNNIEGAGPHYVAHKISNAGRFSVMGNEFTAYTQGTVFFNDGYVTKTTAPDAIGAFNSRDSYSITVSDTVAPVIEVLGVMPKYATKKADTDDDTKNVVLPKIVAVSENGDADITVTVTDKSGESVEVTEITEGENKGRYSFEPLKDGAYTVTVTAVRAGSESVTATYTINVGDVVAPNFKVTAPSATLRYNSEFTFAAITDVVGDEGESTSDYTVTKRLLAPDKSEVQSFTGSFGTYAARPNNGSKITLDKSGTYTVVYEVTDKVGNTNTIQYTFTVPAQRSANNVSLTMLSTILIIVGVLLIAGVIVYFVRYRKVKPKDGKNDKSKK